MYSGLMWSKEANQAGKGMTWNEAKEYVKKLELAGHKDWRLPSKAEFQSLGLQCPGWMIEHWMIGDWLEKKGFTFTEANKEVWLSGEMATDKNYAYSAALTYWGVLGGSEKSSERLVWPVRSGRK